MIIISLFTKYSLDTDNHVHLSSRAGPSWRCQCARAVNFHRSEGIIKVQTVSFPGVEVLNLVPKDARGYNHHCNCIPCYLRCTRTSTNGKSSPQRRTSIFSRNDVQLLTSYAIAFLLPAQRSKRLNSRSSTDWSVCYFLLVCPHITQRVSRMLMRFVAMTKVQIKDVST